MSNTDSSECGGDKDEAGTEDLEDTEDSGHADTIRMKRPINTARLSTKKQKHGRGKARFRGLKFRGSPFNLTEILKELKPEQRTAVEEIGLGSILDFDIAAVPTKLAYYACLRYLRTSLNLVWYFEDTLLSY